MSSSSRLRVISVIGAAAFGLAACGHDDKTYIIETERDAPEPATVVAAEPQHNTVTAQIELEDDEVQIVRQYYIERDCPPGYDRVGDGCVAPAVTETRYVIGQPLPRDVVAVDLPPDLVVRLEPLPQGYAYRVVDGDLVIVREADLIVLDANDLY